MTVQNSRLALWKALQEQTFTVMNYEIRIAHGALRIQLQNSKCAIHVTATGRAADLAKAADAFRAAQASICGHISGADAALAFNPLSVQFTESRYDVLQPLSKPKKPKKPKPIVTLPTDLVDSDDALVSRSGAIVPESWAHPIVPGSWAHPPRDRELDRLPTIEVVSVSWDGSRYTLKDGRVVTLRELRAMAANAPEPEPELAVPGRRAIRLDGDF